MVSFFRTQYGQNGDKQHGRCLSGTERWARGDLIHVIFG